MVKGGQLGQTVVKVIVASIAAANTSRPKPTAIRLTTSWLYRNVRSPIAPPLLGAPDSVKGRVM